MLVDGNEQCAGAIIRALGDNEHAVTAVRCVLAVNDGMINCVDWGNEQRQLATANFNVALVAGNVPDAPHSGWDLMSRLVDSRIDCVGIHSYVGSNIQGRNASGEHLADNGAAARLIEQLIARHFSLTKLEQGDLQWIWI